MKLWLLRPIDGDALWDPWFDKAFGFVIRAETEAKARAIAAKNGGDEMRGEFLGKRNGPKDSAWNAEHSTCVELTADGPAEVVIRDFQAA